MKRWSGEDSIKATVFLLSAKSRSFRCHCIDRAPIRSKEGSLPSICRHTRWFTGIGPSSLYKRIACLHLVKGCAPRIESVLRLARWISDLANNVLTTTNASVLQSPFWLGAFAIVSSQVNETKSSGRRRTFCNCRWLRFTWLVSRDVSHRIAPPCTLAICSLEESPAHF